MPANQIDNSDSLSETNDTARQGDGDYIPERTMSRSVVKQPTTLDERDDINESVIVKTISVWVSIALYARV